MSEKGVRETICSGCTHRQVCAYKDDYLRMLSALQETFNRFPEETRSHIGFLDPACNFVEKKEINVITYRQSEVEKGPDFADKIKKATETACMDLSRPMLNPVREPYYD